MSHTFFVIFYSKKSLEVAKELDEKIEAYHKVLDSFANVDYGIHKQPIWTRPQMAKELGAKNETQATDEEILVGIGKSLKIFNERV